MNKNLPIKKGVILASMTFMTSCAIDIESQRVKNTTEKIEKSGEEPTENQKIDKGGPFQAFDNRKKDPYGIYRTPSYIEEREKNNNKCLCGYVLKEGEECPNCKRSTSLDRSKKNKKNKKNKKIKKS